MAKKGKSKRKNPVYYSKKIRKGVYQYRLKK